MEGYNSTLPKLLWRNAGYATGKVRAKFQSKNSGNNYTEDEARFRAIMADYLKKLCKDNDAKGTLKVTIFKDYWQKPADVEIDDHNLWIQQLLRWVDMIPGYSNAKLTTKEQNRIYLATFPRGWGREFNEIKNIDNTKQNRKGRG